MLTGLQRLTLAAVIAAILLGPTSMLLLALSTHGHTPAAPPPAPAVTEQPVLAVNA